MWSYVFPFSFVTRWKGCCHVPGALPKIPPGNWAVDVIERATALGIVNGVDSEAQLFGFGQNVKRSEFVAMLTRLFGWEREIVVTPSFADCRPTSWYYDDVETAVAHGAVLRDSASFRPEEYITREEMAVMLVRALGYETLARWDQHRNERTANG